MSRIFKGPIITCDEDNLVAKYLVEENGKIVCVGDTLPEKFAGLPTTEVPALLPSFADTHIHFASYSIFHAGLNVSDARNNGETLDFIREFTSRSKEKLIIAFGASPYSVREKRLVTLDELDMVCPIKPLMLVKYDGHAAIINSVLLNAIKKKISGLRGYNPLSGEMRQEAFFAVSDFVTSSVSPVSLVRSMLKASEDLAARGIGMLNTVSGVGFPLDLDMDIERWVGKGFENGFQVREFVQTMNVRKALKRKLPRIGGCFETALDGCFGSKDAALEEPYEGTDDRGVLYYSDEKVTNFCKAANRAGLQIELHAIGDRAFGQATRALKAALEDYPREDHRHGIIHACLPTDEGIKICKDYKIMLPVQSSFINWKQEPDSYLREILGERANRLNPLKTFVDNGIYISAGSDAPCTEPDPIVWIHNACNNTEPKESLTVFEALRMATYNGYRATFDEKERGSLEVGKIADMAVLSENPYEKEVSKLKELKVEKLYLAGKEYEKPGKAGRHILHGMFSNNKI
jgi:Predicted metal-dependent hydrolase with the TIM-barrel fold